jgi:hypothetical protein
MRILSYVLILLFVLHGLVHVMGFVAYWPLAEVTALPYKTSLLNGRWDIGVTGMRLFSLLWLLAGLLFAGAAAGLLLSQAWAWPVLWAAALLSLAICLLDYGPAWRGALLSGLILLGLIALQGLRTPAAPLAAFPAQTPALTSVPVPRDLPAPVARYYETIAGADVPLVETAVFTGHGTLRFSGITFPTRVRMAHTVGQDYRQLFEATYYGRPLMAADERIIDGHAVLETPVGRVENDPGTDSASNLALWAFALMAPSAYVQDGRVRWEALDENSARLVVPSGDGEDSFTVTFDPATGLVQHMDALRYVDAEQGKKPWRVVPGAWQEVAGMLIPTRLEVIWLEEGTPWLTAEIEDVAYNVPVADYLAEGEASITAVTD